MNSSIMAERIPASMLDAIAIAIKKNICNLPFVIFDFQLKKTRSIRFLQITNQKLQIANYKCFSLLLKKEDANLTKYMRIKTCQAH
jgi:hypothetical protein